MDLYDRLALAALFTLIWTALLASLYLVQRVNPLHSARFAGHVLIAAGVSVAVVLGYR